LQSLLSGCDVTLFIIDAVIRVVPVQEASVVMAISSVHRKDSLEAVHYCIDALKASIPIWKQVIFSLAYFIERIMLNYEYLYSLIALTSLVSC